jgi:hypothetical protein
LSDDTLLAKNTDLVGVQEKLMVAQLLYNDPRILDYIRQHHLFKPSTLKYNLNNPRADSGDVNDIVPVIKRLLRNKVFNKKI